MLCRPGFAATVAICLMGVFLASTTRSQQDTGAQPSSAVSKDPGLKLRPPPKVGEELEPAGRIHLDVVVTDAAGQPVGGLGAQDFQLMDNGQSQKIAAFHAWSGAGGDPASRVSILLVIDTVNSGIVDVSYMRADAEAFLRQNGGHLAQPVTVLLFTDAGFEVLGHTSLDGNALADAVDQIKPMVHTIHSAAGGEASLERFQLSGKAMGAITAHEVTIPGRKLMIWLGPGWPLLPQPEVTYNARSHALNYDAIAALHNQLRQARMVVCSAGGGSEFFVRDYLKPVKSEKDANSANLALQVLAVQSGGRTLDPGNHSHSAELLNACAERIGAYYTLTFDPPHAEKAFEYHGLKLTVDKAGFTANTNAGYYAEP